MPELGARVVPRTSDVDLVFADLCDALRVMEESRQSPREVRRAFSRYVELSQRLTAAMRKDFSNRVGGRWVASSFEGWTPATRLLKYLRNQDQHGEQVFITVHDRHFYSVPDDVEIAGIPGRELIVDGHWHMTDQLLDRPPEGLTFRLREPGDPLHGGEVLLPARTESQFVLYPRTPEDERQVEAAGVSDVYVIARETLSTLTRYYEFYCNASGRRDPT